jgi:glycine/D-amino acid oxidase-like deaminating enzyme
MLRTPPRPDLAVGPMLAAGLTLRHYKAFANCPSLPTLAERFDREMPDYHRWGIHVMAAQNGLGELVLGDSHEYGDAIDPFDKPELDELILAYLARFLVVPNLTIAARWHGIYAKHPSEPWVERIIGERARAVSGVGGHGMTMSFGLADSVVERWLQEES